MSTIRLLLRSLFHYWRSQLAVMLGVVAATAVIGGALIVGDSVRDSLRQMSLDRLGGVDHALVGQRFFRESLAESLQHSLPEVGWRVAPAIVLPCSLSRSIAGSTRRAGDAMVYAADGRLWEQMAGDPATAPTGSNVALSRRLADELQVHVGEEVSLLLEIPAALPRDSLLGDRNETVTELTLTVSQIEEDDTTPGRFGLNPSQQLPLNAFVDLETLQRQIGLEHRPVSRRNPTEKPARVNALFAQAPESAAELQIRRGVDVAGPLTAALGELLTLDDLALRLVVDEERSMISLQSEQMILDRPVVDAAQQAATNLQVPRMGMLVYLINEMWNPEDPDRYAMYSIAAGLDLRLMEGPPFGPFSYVAGHPPHTMPAPERGIPVVINEWLAEDLGVAAGDEIRAKYQEVGDRGELPEREVTFVVSGVIKLEGPAADPGMTPHVEGITDADTFGDWRQPFPMDLDRVTTRDEDFWDEYRTTPKVFLPLDQAQELWRSRYGELTSFRIANRVTPPSPPSLAVMATTYEDVLLQLLTGRQPRVATRRVPGGGTSLLPSTTPLTSLVFEPVKRQGLEAAQGTTDFTGLFLGFSFFLIAAAMLLIGLLFRLGIERRVSELGLLSAVGLSPKQVRQLFLGEGGLIVLVGGLVGTCAAVAYAGLMIYGLKTWWIGAIGTRFLHVSVRPVSLVIGFFVAVIVAILAIWWGLRQLRGIAARDMLAGITTPLLSVASQARRGRIAARLALSAFGLCIVLLGAAWFGLVSSAEAFAGFSWQVVTFFIVGTTALVGSLAGLSWWLDSNTTAAVRGAGPAAVVRLGLRNASRHRGRSVLTAGLIALATFVIVALATARRNPAVEQPLKASGNGGFTLVAESSTPILYDLNTSAGRTAAGVDTGDNQPVTDLLEQVRFALFRMKPGEDASCLNLYQTQLPTILGVPEDVIKEFTESDRFKFVGTPAGRPWELLTTPLATGNIPVLGDMNTLLYSLHKGPGATIDATTTEGRDESLEVVGMLDGSVFQGVLLMSEQNFLRLFPERVGFQYFLIEVEPSRSNEVADLLETHLADYGLDAERVADRLASFLAVQNTYLSTFQTLGGLGLLLGTLGLATVMLRNVLERRGEIALFRAVGFRPSQVSWLVLAENAFLMLWGLLAGTLSALLAMLPHLRSTGADVPWGGLQMLLIGVFVVGMLAATAAVREALRTPILATLRSD